MQLRCAECNKLLMTVKKVDGMQTINNEGAENPVFKSTDEYCHIETKCPRCKCMNTFGI